MLKNGTVTALLIHTVINLYAKFEVSSFNHSREIRGSQNSKSGSRDLHMTPSDLNLHFSLVLTAVHLCAKFEVSSFNHSRDNRGPQNAKVGHVTPHGPFWPNFADFGYFFPFSICLSNLTRIASSMTDIWLLYEFMDLAAKCLFRPLLVSFAGFWPLKLWNYCFDPQRYALPAETRVLRYCAMRIKIGSWVSSVALFKY